jgi:hypothetical protein
VVADISAPDSATGELATVEVASAGELLQLHVHEPTLLHIE